MQIALLPGFSALAKDYVAHFEDSPVREFFAVPPTRSNEAVEEWLVAALQGSQRDQNRSAVVQSITRLHNSLGSLSEKASEHLRQLSDSKTFAIVTGQQVGVLGGPLYTFYKAFTAIELARRYSDRFPGYAFVPVFWLETEDHDLEEATSVNVLDKDGALASLRYAPTAAADNTQWRKQVGPTQLEAEPLDTFFTTLRASLGQTEFSEALLAQLQRLYAPGTTFAQAFAKLLLMFFGDDGLLIVDGSDPALKAAGRELFLNELRTSPQLSEKIVLQSVKLEEHYHAQVKPRALNLFLVENGERMPIVEHEPSPHATDRTFFLKGTRRTFTIEELETLIETSPERFSPNVVLRPLYQDTLLPTAAYVAGPGEIAYFAQFATAYDWAGLPMPIIAPRVTATLIEERLERILDKYRIDVSQLLIEGRQLEENIVSSLVAENLAQAFEESASKVEEAIEALRETVKLTDPTLDASLTTLKGKVATTVRDFGNKVLAADRKKHTTTRQQLDRLFSALLPNDELQERELSLVYFLNKYGPSFTDRLKTMLAPLVEEHAEHHILHLNAQQPVGSALPQAAEAA